MTNGDAPGEAEDPLTHTSPTEREASLDNISGGLSAVPHATDPRIAGVLDVIGGTNLHEAAEQHSLDPVLLERWTAMFVAGGTASVANRPSDDIIAHRDRFLAAFSFEIRSPLAIALGWVDLLLNDALPDEGYRLTAKRLQAALGQLSERVGDVELLVAAALGGLSVKKEATTVGAVCDIEGLAAVEGAGPGLAIEVDPELFRRVIRDLWDAASLEPEPTLRRIRASIEGPWVQISVIRHGPPIDTDLLKVLYEPFDGDHLGSGVTVGLYLARALTVAHGGSLGIDQDDEQALLWVRVPLPERQPMYRGSGIPRAIDR